MKEINANEFNRIQHQNSIYSNVSNIKDFDPSKSNNSTLLLHSAVINIFCLIRDCQVISSKDDIENKKAIEESYNQNKRNHNKNAVASGLGMMTCLAQLGLPMIGMTAIGLNRLETVFKFTEQGITARKELNRGNIESVDRLAIDSSTKKADKNQNDQKQLSNIEERARELTNSSINRLIDAYQVRG